MKQGCGWLRIAVVTCMLARVLALSAGVVAYWDFNSGGAGIVEDVSGNGHSLTNSGVTFSDGAAVFNGSHNVFSTVSKLDLRDYGNLTIECFVRTAGASAPMILVEQANPFFEKNGAFLVDVNEGNVPGTVMGGFCCSSSGPQLNLDITPAGAVSDSQWHHVAIVHDRSKTGADRSMLYVDGVAQAPLGSWTADTFLTYCDATLYLGSRGNGSMKYVGELDDVRISDAALTPSQFLQQRTEAPPTVIAHWRFDAENGLADSSGNGHTLTGSGVSFSGNVARFDGAQTLNTASTLDLSTYTNLTVEFFLRSTSRPTSMIVLEHTSQFFSNPGAFLVSYNETNNAGQMMGGFCTAAGTKLNLDTTAGKAADDGQWHHVAIVYDLSKTGADRSMFYLDGKAQSVYAAWTDGSATAFRNATLYVGSRKNTASKYIGELDDVRITGAALLPGQFLRTPSTEIPRVIAYWPFSGKQPLQDATGNGHTLANAGVTFKDDAAVFDGSHTAFSTKPWTLNLRPYPAVTVEYFVRTPTTNICQIVEHSPYFANQSTRGGFIAVLNEKNLGQLESGFSMPGYLTYNIDSSEAGALTDGLWHHVALVYDPDKRGDDRVRVYLDRVQQGKRITTWDGDLDSCLINAVLFIGSRNNTSNRFIGELDDLKITGAVLNPSEFLAQRTYFGGTFIQMR